MYRRSEKIAAGFLGVRVCHVERSETSLITPAGCAITTTGYTSSPTNTAPRCISGLRITSRVVCTKHRHGGVDGFTRRYHLNRLVWVEHFRNVNDAIACEKKLKGWRRSRKIALIEQTNPRWFDLSDNWEQQPKFYDSPWETEEMIRDSSLCSE